MSRELNDKLLPNPVLSCIKSFAVWKLSILKWWKAKNWFKSFKLITSLRSLFFLGTVKMLERKTLSVLFTSLMQPTAGKHFISLFIADFWGKFIFIWRGELRWEGSTISSNSSPCLITLKKTPQGSSVIDSHFERKCLSFPANFSGGKLGCWLLWFNSALSRMWVGIYWIWRVWIVSPTSLLSKPGSRMGSIIGIRSTRTMTLMWRITFWMMFHFSTCWKGSFSGLFWFGTRLNVLYVAISIQGFDRRLLVFHS